MCVRSAEWQRSIVALSTYVRPILGGRQRPRLLIKCQNIVVEISTDLRRVNSAFLSDRIRRVAVRHGESRAAPQCNAMRAATRPV